MVPDNVVHDLFGTSSTTIVSSSEIENNSENHQTESMEKEAPESLGNVMEGAENGMHENNENTIPTDPEQLSNIGQEIERNASCNAVLD